MVPSAASSSAPNAANPSTLPTEPVEFDGIAMFLVNSLVSFLEAFKDPYYIHVIEPDEKILLNKDGPGGGVIASWQGKLVSITKDGKSVQGEKGGPIQKPSPAVGKQGEVAATLHISNPASRYCRLAI